MPLATIGAAMGSHVRVGLEDSLWIGPGQLATSNAQQVTRIRTILEALNFEIATPDEAREVLQLKGRDKVDSRPVSILVAPDSFKGTFAAAQVSAHIAAGIRAAGAAAVELPVADGGEGTFEVLVRDSTPVRSGSAPWAPGATTSKPSSRWRRTAAPSSNSPLPAD